MKALQAALPGELRGQFVGFRVAGENRAAASPDIPQGAARLAEILGAVPSRNHFGEHLALRRWFSESIGVRGARRARWMRRRCGCLRPMRRECVADPEQWLFLDTETTGLAGGTGTYPFLVGIAWWDAGGLEVEQFFMREHSEEHSVLVALAERMAERRVLVTFNGKSFDWPLLETRYRMTRTIPAPAPRAHLDFLHPGAKSVAAAAGFGAAAGAGKARAGMESRRGCDVRADPADLFRLSSRRLARSARPDLPSQSDGPAGAGGTGDCEPLRFWAIRSRHGRDALELFGVSRICERRGETMRARTLYERSIASELPPETDRAAQKSLARLAKREGDHASACELWEKMLGASREGFEAYEQLAIHYERRGREPQRAAELARKATCRTAQSEPARPDCAARVPPQSRARFERRLARLERKAGRGLIETLRTDPQLEIAETRFDSLGEKRTS